MKPPPEYEHLELHWVDVPVPGKPSKLWIINYEFDIDMWITPGRDVSPSVAAENGWRYHCPAVPLVDNTATVDVVARIIRLGRDDHMTETKVASLVINGLLEKSYPGAIPYTRGGVMTDRCDETTKEIDVTPEMIEAGASELARYTTVFDTLEDGAERIFRTMIVVASSALKDRFLRSRSTGAHDMNTSIRLPGCSLLTAYSIGDRVTIGIVAGHSSVRRTSTQAHLTFDLTRDQVRELLISLANTAGISLGVSEAIR